MNPRTLLLAIAALTTAGLTAFLVHGWMERQRAQMVVKAPAVKKAEGTSVLITQRDIGTGTFLKEADLKWQVWPEGSLSPAYAVKGKRTKKEFVGSVVRSSIVAGQPITDSSVVKIGERGFLAAVLRPGLRAVSVPVTATSAIAGLVFPGDRVDLILTHKFSVPGEGKKKLRQASETVLTNVRILALDQRTDDKKVQGGKKGGVPKTATIEITPKQAEMISVALNLGKLSLSLRSLALKKTGPGGKEIQVKEKSNARGRTLTIDTEVSRLLSVKGDEVIILRGGASTKSAIDKKKSSTGGTGDQTEKATQRDETAE